MLWKMYWLSADDPNAVQGRNWEGGPRGTCPLLHFTLCLRTCLQIEAQHIFNLNYGLVLYYPSYYKYTNAPLSKLPSCAPVAVATRDSKNNTVFLFEQTTEFRTLDKQTPRILRFFQSRRIVFSKIYLRILANIEAKVDICSLETLACLKRNKKTSLW